MDKEELLELLYGEPVGVYDSRFKKAKVFPYLGSMKDEGDTILYVKSNTGELLEVDQFNGRLYETGNTISIENGSIVYNH